MSEAWARRFTTKEIEEMFEWIEDRVEEDSMQSFVKSIKSQWKSKGTLSDKQWGAIKNIYYRLGNSPREW